MSGLTPEREAEIRESLGGGYPEHHSRCSSRHGEPCDCWHRHDAKIIVRLLLAELDLLREELRLREESQIPMIPRGAQANVDALEAELDLLRERAERAEKALEEIRAKAEWYASIHYGPDLEVHHALKVEVLNIAEEALSASPPSEEPA